MSAPRDDDSDALLETQMLRINDLCNQFEAGWQKGRQPALEELLVDLSGTDRQAALRDLLPLDIEYRQRAGLPASLEDYAQRFPDTDRGWLASLFGPTTTGAKSSHAQPAVPQRLGDYEIIGRIGGGGMGTVYKALHVRMGRIVALKVLRPEIQQNPVLIQRFDREVRAAARLTHPHIVAALDAREQDGVHFLITEFVEGLDLEATIRRDGALPVAVAVKCVLDAARGLDFAHRNGVIHRDIKPANLLRDQQGLVKVLDMGLARLDAVTSTTATELTNSGMVLGTPAYMAPEQARDVRRADARSDIYSLGCTLYYLLTARPAFSGATALDTVMSHISHPIPSLTAANASIPLALEQIFSRMIAKEPGDRFQTAAEVVAALETLSLTPAPDHETAVTTGVTGVAPGSITQMIEAVKSGRSAETQPIRSDRKVSQQQLWIGGLLAVIVVCVLIVMMLPPKAKQQAATTSRHTLEFNGTSSYVAVPTLNPAAGKPYTIEAVVTPDANRISNVVSWLGPDWMAIYCSGNRWGLARRVGEESHLVLIEQPAEQGVAVHVAGVFNGSNLKLFVNGQLADPKLDEFSLPETTGGLYIGGVPPDKLPADQNQRFFKGRIHAVRISQGIRYSKPFKSPKTLGKDANTLALYHFNAGKGVTVKDDSGKGHDAQIRGAEWISTQQDAD